MVKWNEDGTREIVEEEEVYFKSRARNAAQEPLTDKLWGMSNWIPDFMIRRDGYIGSPAPHAEITKEEYYVHENGELWLDFESRWYSKITQYHGSMWKLMCWSFYMHWLPSYRVRYIDGNPLNIHLDNLIPIKFDEKSQEWVDIGWDKRSIARTIDLRLGRKVRVVETGEVYNSESAAARAIGGQQVGVHYCLTGKRSTHKGFHFEYA